MPLCTAGPLWNLGRLYERGLACTLVRMCRPTQLCMLVRPCRRVALCMLEATWLQRCPREGVSRSAQELALRWASTLGLARAWALRQ